MPRVLVGLVENRRAASPGSLSVRVGSTKHAFKTGCRGRLPTGRELGVINWTLSGDVWWFCGDLHSVKLQADLGRFGRS
jgi:hypothetical protein